MRSTIKHNKPRTIAIVALLFLLLSFSACFDDFDDVFQPPSALSIKKFVYRGMKTFYLYKSEDPVLGNNYFESREELEAYLNNFNSPEEFFYSLRSEQDRFSIIVPDFHKLEKALNGIRLNNGMEFGLVKIPSTGQVFGYVRYVLPNSSAATQGIERGMLFNRIDGTELSASNYSDLLAPDSYTIGLATLNNDTLTPLPQSITLTKTQLSENPIHLHKIIDTLGHHIGYLMYNGFISRFNSELNSVFADFKAAGVTDLVIDLRYNPGGSIETSKDLASMITGQFEGELFITEVFNNNFEDQKIYFDNNIHTGAGINSLQLSKVYILTTQSTASASELLINGLNAYIDVIQIGERTVGKFQGSITVYDSPDFTRANVRPGHTYAMQPLILKTVNANGFTDFVDGLVPDIEQHEIYADLGQLGNPNERLLHTAIQHIIGPPTRPAAQTTFGRFEQIGESGMNQPTYQRMYSEWTKSLKSNTKVSIP